MSSDTARKLLIVDQHPACRRFLQTLAEEAGYAVLTASDGAEGYRCVMAEHPHIIITDWMMSGMDGIEMIRKIRAELNWYPYILLVTDQTDQRYGLDSGADDFVVKPVRAENLLPRIRAGERIVTLQDRLREKNLQLNVANQQLAELAITDPLSGLLNRRAFFEEAKKEWHRSSRYELPLSCLMIDIDHFKLVNDTHGHRAGDSLIRIIGDALRGKLRDTDLVCRYGGEEFCVLLTNTPLEAAFLLAERLRRIFHELQAPYLPSTFRMTVSVGLATRTLHSLSEQALIDEADQALLIAKRSGRDRSVRYDELGRLQTLAPPEQPYSTLETPLQPPDGSVVSYQLINTLLAALSYRDPNAVAHSQRVARLCGQFAQFLGWPPEDRIVLEMAALLHESGRLALRDDELAQTERFGDENTVLAERLRNLTIELVQNCFSNARLLRTLRSAPTWYETVPTDLLPEQLPLGARVLAMICFFDDVVHGRGTWTQHAKGEAIQILHQWSGTRFDPEIVSRFKAMLRLNLKPRDTSCDAPPPSCLAV